MLTIEDIPGYASQVYSGWVWMIGSNEYRFTKSLTKEGCEDKVLEVCSRLGVEQALDLLSDGFEEALAEHKSLI